MTPHADWRMPEGRGLLTGCGAHDQTVGQCASEANPADDGGINGGTDTSSAYGRAAVPRYGVGLCDYRFDPESRCDGIYDQDGRCDQCGRPSIFEDYDPEDFVT